MATYSTIKKLLDSNQISIGTVLTVPEGNSRAEYILVQKYYPDTGSYKRTDNAILMRRYVTGDTTDFSDGARAYTSFTLDNYMTSFQNRMFGSNGMVRCLVPLTLPCYDPSQKKVVTNVTRSVFAPSLNELNNITVNEGDKISSSETNNVPQTEGRSFTYFDSTFNNQSLANIRNKRKAARSNNMTSVRWATRSPGFSGSVAYGYVAITDEGKFDLINQSSTLLTDNSSYVRPCISININVTVEVNDNSYAIIPNLPATASTGSISIPANVMSDQLFSVSWSAGTDADTASDALKYKIERSFNGSDVWESVGTYQGQYSIQTSVPYNKSNATVIYRMQCLDNYDNTDDAYVYSSPATITNNTAPVLYGPLHVTGRNKNDYLTLSWNSASDNDGNLTGYRLYRIVDGGGKELIAGANETPLESIVTTYIDYAGDWSTVVYSIVAYDEYGLESAEIVSDTIELVQKNTMSLAFDSTPGTGKLTGDEDGEDPYAGAAEGDVYFDFILTDPKNSGKTYTYDYLVLGENGMKSGAEGEQFTGAFNNNQAVIRLTVPKRSWQAFRNGQLNVTLTVHDSENNVVTIEQTCYKAVFELVVQTKTFAFQNTPSSIPDDYTMNIEGSFNNTTMTVEVCRNMGVEDEEDQVWHTLTDAELAKVNTGEKIAFTDTTPSASDFGFAVRISLSRDADRVLGPVRYLSAIHGMVGYNIFEAIYAQISSIKSRINDYHTGAFEV